MIAPTVVDLFCGCGGFGLGAEQAGFQTIAAVDIEPNLQSAYKLNFPKANVVQADVSTLDHHKWVEIIGSTRPDGVIGGPPCQGFSRIGKRDHEDERNQLIFEFYRQINILRPKFFVMENVEGILDSYGQRILSSALSTLNEPYEIVGPMLIDAADVGAATRRRRAILIGFLKDEMNAPDAKVLTNKSGYKKCTVWDAICDLPGPLQNVDKANLFGCQKLPVNDTRHSEFSVSARLLPKEGVGWERAIEWLRQQQVSGFFPTRHTTTVIERFGNIEPGRTDKVSKYPRLSWDGVCPTLRAGTGSDRGSFQAVRPIHPDEPRVITVREAARIQGFPDWFVFHPTKWHSFRMIGNSVSPLVARHILAHIFDKLEIKLAA